MNGELFFANLFLWNKHGLQQLDSEHFPRDFFKWQGDHTWENWLSTIKRTKTWKNTIKSPDSLLTLNLFFHKINFNYRKSFSANESLLSENSFHRESESDGALPSKGVRCHWDRKVAGEA